jgi:hypothetical protein
MLRFSSACGFVPLLAFFLAVFLPGETDKGDYLNLFPSAA